MICESYIKANKKFLKSYNPSKLLTHIMSLDTNNLYRHSTLHLLLTEIIHWVNPKNLI